MDINPAKTALLVLDFQETILASLPNADTVVMRVADAIAAMRAAGGTVAYVRLAFTQQELADFPSYSQMGQRMNRIGQGMHPAAAGTHVDARLMPRPGDIVVRKRRVGPFGTTDLNQKLRNRSIDTLVVCGVHTSGCVLSCVREAHDLDYRIIVLADCCADREPTVGQFLTETVFPKQAQVFNFCELERPFRSADTEARADYGIRELYAAYNEAIDSSDAEAWTATFVDDGVFHHPSRRWSGREELRRFVEERSARLEEAPIIDQRHWNDAIKVEAVGALASASCDMLVVGRSRLDGSRQIAAEGRYEDTLVETSDGWRFLERRLTVQ